MRSPFRLRTVRRPASSLLIRREAPSLRARRPAVNPDADCLPRRAAAASLHSSRGTEKSGPLSQGGPLMNRSCKLTLALLIVPCALFVAPPSDAAKPEGTLTVAVATFGNERWLPNLYVGAEDVVLKPMYENLLSRDAKTGELTPMLAERWQVLDGGRTWKFQLRKGVRFHSGAEL